MKKTEMRRHPIILTGLLLTMLLLPRVQAVHAEVGPFTPTEDVEPQGKKSAVDPLKLPYKQTTVDDLFLEKNTATDTGTATDKLAEKKGIEWSKLPFIPSKNPVLVPAGDPKI